MTVATSALDALQDLLGLCRVEVHAAHDEQSMSSVRSRTLAMRIRVRPQSKRAVCSEVRSPVRGSGVAGYHICL